ncbi:hypothetical protein ACM9XA_13300 [Xanthomonas sacchari]|uniref:hypothetical protein n=1 Tax=Xanthomonas sp. LMG 12462 TaxID=1591134 RepID=UPI00126544D8|nr:hypothetical protein [Xanthomonas sp. LMG 12462]KAB7764355.1 hypothetical protein CEK69_18710 [Xanthomonas sp. LMG 12462]
MAFNVGQYWEGAAAANPECNVVINNTTSNIEQRNAMRAPRRKPVQFVDIFRFPKTRHPMGAGSHPGASDFAEHWPSKHRACASRGHWNSKSDAA